jgi:hypothetical protein
MLSPREFLLEWRVKIVYREAERLESRRIWYLRIIVLR